MPHENNLINYIEITGGGLVQIKAGVGGNDLTRAQAFIDLVGLDRVPGHVNYSDKDDRWDNRLKVADIAQRQFNKYTSAVPSTDIETIVDLARTTGYFSIWYYQFIGHDEIIGALLNGINVGGNPLQPFPGSHTGSFDDANHYNTVARPCVWVDFPECVNNYRLHYTDYMG
ncbi:hypothetical protein [Flavihumibacter sp. UBA7668]|uniref:hypothetical protein n=1 Tax=Flavihumibacter sp. UBA7668 TaxID=1946542 RepID=UPI0025B9098F|nr:hypothetical protein [Flavihumibacter sp. UBA7668]